MSLQWLPEFESKIYMPISCRCKHVLDVCIHSNARKLFTCFKKKKTIHIKHDQEKEI